MFGGAGASVEPRNADFVEAYLKVEGLPIAARHLRGGHARRVNYFPLTGRVLMLELRREDAAAATTEARYRTSLEAELGDGSVELFG